MHSQCHHVGDFYGVDSFFLVIHLVAISILNQKIVKLTSVQLTRHNFTIFHLLMLDNRSRCETSLLWSSLCRTKQWSYHSTGSPRFFTQSNSPFQQDPLFTKSSRYDCTAQNISLPLIQFQPLYVSQQQRMRSIRTIWWHWAISQIDHSSCSQDVITQKCWRCHNRCAKLIMDQLHRWRRVELSNASYKDKCPKEQPIEMEIIRDMWNKTSFTQNVDTLDSDISRDSSKTECNYYKQIFNLSQFEDRFRRKSTLTMMSRNTDDIDNSFRDVSVLSDVHHG
jgi:hypothetical protein